jgi:hypothetical protein
MSNSSIISIPKLRDNGSNWVDYESKVRSALGAKGVIRHIDGTAVEPQPYAKESGHFVSKPGTKATDEEIEAREKRIDEYTQREHTAKHILLTSVSPRVASIIRSKSSNAMWNEIKKDATNKSEVHRTQVKRRLHELKFDGSVGGMRSHLNSLTEARDELLGMGLIVDDFTSIIINSMPDSYHNLVSSISGASRATGSSLDSDNLIVLLTEEDDYRKNENKRGKSKSDNLALNVNKGKHGRKSDLKCDNCGRKFHTKDNCYYPGGGKEGQAPWQKDKSKSANTATSSENKSETKSEAKWDNKKEVGGHAFSAIRQNQLQALNSRSHKINAAVDSGASVHYCPDRQKFISYSSMDEEEIFTADGRPIDAIGRGDVHILLPNKGDFTEVTLQDVYHVPTMTTTLISVSRMDQAGYIAHFGHGVCAIEAPNKKIIAELPVRNGLYVLGVRKINSDTALSATQKLSLAQAHRALGHIHNRAICDGIRLGNIEGIELSDTEEVFCDACAQAKPHRRPFPEQAKNRAENFGDRMFMDLWGPASVESIGRKKYSLDFTDDSTRWSEVDFLATKDQCFKSYCTFEKSLETQYGVKIKILRCDRAGEFMSDEFMEHTNSKGTRREFTVHDTHEQVGVAERLNRTKLELARAMLFESGLPIFLWAEAVRHMIWLKNRLPTRSLKGRTPFDARFGRKPDLSSVVPFGTRAWVKLVHSGKLEARAKLGYFVGFDFQSTGYRIYYPERRSVGVEREVVFDTSSRDNIIVDIDDIPLQDSRTLTTRRNREDLVGEEVRSVEEDKGVEMGEDGGNVGIEGGSEREQVVEEHNTVPEGRSLRTRSGNTTEPGHYWNLAGKPRRGNHAGLLLNAADTLFALSFALETAPPTLEQALNGPNAEDWHKSWRSELDQLVDIGK